jgi:hypothetical protein
MFYLSGLTHKVWSTESFVRISRRQKSTYDVCAVKLVHTIDEKESFHFPLFAKIQDTISPYTRSKLQVQFTT